MPRRLARSRRRGKPPRGGHTELMLDRFAREDARIREGGELPAVWSAYS